MLVIRDFGTESSAKTYPSVPRQDMDVPRQKKVLLARIYSNLRGRIVATLC
jgi:hypothetical protein